MKIRRLHLRRFQQFHRTTLDFTHPVSGATLDRVCLIGRNGTGKSTALRVLANMVGTQNYAVPGLAALELEVDGAHVTVVCHPQLRGKLWLKTGSVTPLLDEMERLTTADEITAFVISEAVSRISMSSGDATWARCALGPGDALLYSPAESHTNNALTVEGAPQGANLAAAMARGRENPTRFDISDQTVAEMWMTLTQLVEERESERRVFENRADSLQKTKQQLIEEFEHAYPNPLEGLAQLWRPILHQAGLVFDLADARIPVRLDESLEAYVKLERTGERIPYKVLSTGMRTFLFRLGHIFLLHFRGQVRRGFLLVDEPENSLFPDFLFELMDSYAHAIRAPDGSTSTQCFFATHNPIVAAQFEPHERVVLEWTEDATVVARRGLAPVGDDPNDILRKDFQLDHLMGRRGQEAWERYLALRRRIRNERDEQVKAELITQAAALGRDYGFGAPEAS